MNPGSAATYTGSNTLLAADGAFGHANVLLVDGHVEFCENIAEILDACVFGVQARCLRVDSLEHALALSARMQLDLVLLDLHLPDGHGREPLSALRSQQPFAQIVCITGDSTVESAISALDRGAFGYLLKPFRVQALIEVVSQAIGRSKLLRERETLRNNLELSERRYRDIIDRVPAFVLALNEHGAIEHWNKQLEAVTGIHAGEVLGSPGSNWLSGDGTQRLPLRNGGHRIVRWKSSVVSAAGDQAQVTYAIGVDVTDETEMQRRAVRAERLAAIGTLAAGLAHEVRNPLNSAALQLQLMERRLDKGKVDAASLAGVLRVIKSEIQRLDRLVTDFLEFARPTPTHLQPTDLVALAAEVLDLMNEEAERAGVCVQRVFAQDVGLVPVDSKRVRQVLLNLIKNSLEAMKGTGGTLSVRIEAKPSAQSVEVEVEDTGPGFPQEAPIFDAFFTTKEQGTGLGLSIVHRIVTEHDGTIGCSSEPGRTCFCISLPSPELTQARSSEQRASSETYVRPRQ